MSRTVIAPESLRNYLLKSAETGKLSHGLIIGQPSSERKDYVIHLAQTSNDSVCIKEPEEEEPPSEEATEVIIEEALVHHLISATRMIPGSFFVLGFFVVAKEDVFAEKSKLESLKRVIRTSNCTLKRMKYNAAERLPEHIEDQLILFYSSVTKTLVCKSYNTKTYTLSPVEWKFVKNLPDWRLFETSYDFDDIFPLVETEEGVNLEHNFVQSLDNITLYIQNSEIFIQHEKVDDQMLLETYLKKNNTEEFESLRASIFLTELISRANTPKLEKFEGTIKFQGTVLSRIWSHPKASFKEIEEFIRNDIVRSVAARTQIYCDSLSNSTASKEIFISEPPRRVFIRVPEFGGIQCCEYLFRNETPEVACDQAKEILDLEIDPTDVLMNSEGLPDLDDSLSNADAILPALKTKKTSNEITQHMYILGIATAIVVLVVSIALHFILR